MHGTIECTITVFTTNKPMSHRAAMDMACGCLLSLLTVVMRLPRRPEGDVPAT